MLFLSILLSAAAGVNAMIDQNVETVLVSEISFLCADDCRYREVFYARSGHWCDQFDLVAVETYDDNRASPRFICSSEKPQLPPDTVFTPRGNPSRVPPCKLYPMAKLEGGCSALRGGPGRPGETVQWLDIEAQRHGQEPSLQVCGERARQKMYACLESNDGPRDFGTCEAEGQEEINQCLREQQ